IQLTSGTIQASGQVVIPNPVAFNSQNAAVTVQGSGQVVFTGPVLLGGGTNSLTVNNAGGVLSTGVVSGGGNLVALVKGGTGTLTLTNANNYVGQTVIAQGILNVQNSAALGGATGTTVLSLAALQLQPGPGAAGVVLNSPLTLFGNGPGGNGA